MIAAAAQIRAMGGTQSPLISCNMLLRVCIEHALSFPRPSRGYSRAPFADDGIKNSGTRDPHPAQSHPVISDIWSASRTKNVPARDSLPPGARRPLNRKNIVLAYQILHICAEDLFMQLWRLHPWRTLIMITLEFLRGIFPAFRGYSHALLINELQSLVSSNDFTWSRLIRLVVCEATRIGLENIVDCIASSNEDVVHDSVRFFMEYKQMEQRVKLDVPTLSDPNVRDLLYESDLFVRSFNGVSAFGLFSTFDFIRILTLLSELISHALVLSSLAMNGPHLSALLLSVFSSALPLLLRSGGFDSYPRQDDCPLEASMTLKEERMRSLAHCDAHRPEIALFGFGTWILDSWARARKTTLQLGRRRYTSGGLPYFMPQINMSGILTVAQNISLIVLLQSPSASLGSYTLYQSSIQSLFFTGSSLVHSLSMAYQSIFLMAAFCAAMDMQPRLQPKTEKPARYNSRPRGMAITARNVSYTYPGCKSPAIKDVNLTITPGETVAIVGFNGSGKSTLAKILLRVLDFDHGELSINDVDIREYRPEDYHAHTAALLQDFSRYDASVQENVVVGCISELHNPSALGSALHLADATSVVESLPRGLKTKLDVASSYPHSASSTTQELASDRSDRSQQGGLSGGEWQRLALSRAFIRAQRPEVDLILLDEPTSTLDPCAQKHIFESIEALSRTPEGGRTKTVVLITHRLSIARRADRIAMMEKGTITEFGTHGELLRRNGRYAALYRASV